MYSKLKYTGGHTDVGVILLAFSIAKYTVKMIINFSKLKVPT